MAKGRSPWIGKGYRLGNIGDPPVATAAGPQSGKHAPVPAPHKAASKKQPASTEARPDAPIAKRTRSKAAAAEGLEGQPNDDTAAAGDVEASAVDMGVDSDAESDDSDVTDYSSVGEGIREDNADNMRMEGGPSDAEVEESVQRDPTFAKQWRKQARRDHCIYDRHARNGWADRDKTDDQLDDVVDWEKLDATSVGYAYVEAKPGEIADLSVNAERGYAMDADGNAYRLGAAGKDGYVRLER